MSFLTSNRKRYYAFQRFDKTGVTARKEMVKNKRRQGADSASFHVRGRMMKNRRRKSKKKDNGRGKKVLTNVTHCCIATLSCSEMIIKIKK
jgi:hypothetical protein